MIYLFSINMVKVLIGLLENADKWLTKTEEKLANQELLTTIFQFPTTINRILYELEVNRIVYLFYKSIRQTK